VLILAGEFVMGSDTGQEDEKPQRKVFLDRYYINKNLVTVAQYRRFCNATGRLMPNPPRRRDWEPDHPIVNVFWKEAMAYCEWLSGDKPGSVTLPTEA